MYLQKAYIVYKQVRKPLDCTDAQADLGPSRLYETPILPDRIYVVSCVLLLEILAGGMNLFDISMNLL